MRRLAHALLLLPLLLAGCAYKVGSFGPAKGKTIAVPMFANDTLHPQIEQRVTNALIRRLQADGTVKIVWEADADIVVTGVITKYSRMVLRTQPDDSDVPREYRLSIEAKVSARERIGGKVVLHPILVTGSHDTFVGSDLQSAELQALPLIAEDLARQIAGLLVERW